jgi:hypothetical protein
MQARNPADIVIGYFPGDIVQQNRMGSDRPRHNGARRSAFMPRLLPRSSASRPTKRCALLTPVFAVVGNGHAEDGLFLGAGKPPHPAVDTNGSDVISSGTHNYLLPSCLRSRRAKSGTDEGALFA